MWAFPNAELLLFVLLCCARFLCRLVTAWIMCVSWRRVVITCMMCVLPNGKLLLPEWQAWVSQHCVLVTCMMCVSEWRVVFTCMIGMCFLGTVTCCLRRSSVDPWGDLTARMHAITVIPDYFHLQQLAHTQQRCYDFQQLTTPLSLHDSTNYGTRVLCLRAAGQNASWMGFSDLSSNQDAFYMWTMNAITLRTPKAAAECITIVLLIRSVGGSNHGLETG